jgi:hypothetical protein
VNQADLAVLAMNRAQDRQRDRVIAAQRDRLRPVLQDFVVSTLNAADRIQEVVRIDRNVADVRDAQRVERRGARRHVVRAQQHRFDADLTRTEARARAVRGAQIEWHADETDIEPLRRPDVRQPHHRGDAACARHRVARQRLRPLGQIRGNEIRGSIHRSSPMASTESQ